MRGANATIRQAEVPVIAEVYGCVRRSNSDQSVLRLKFASILTDLYVGLSDFRVCGRSGKDEVKVYRWFCSLWLF